MLSLFLLLDGTLQADVQGANHECDPFAGVTIDTLGGEQPAGTLRQTLVLVVSSLESSDEPGFMF